MSSSRLQQLTYDLLREYLPLDDITENSRPDWLITEEGKRLELDFLLKPYHIAIEVQGKQHFLYNPFFHKSKDGFGEQLASDEYKRRICEERGIRFFIIETEEDAVDVTSRISALIDRVPKVYNAEQARSKRESNNSGLVLRLLKRHERKLPPRDVRAIVDQRLPKDHPLTDQDLLEALASLVADDPPPSPSPTPIGPKQKKAKPPKTPEQIKKHNRSRRRNMMNRRARQRQVRQVGESWWIVWGGRDSHYVTRIDDRYYCDCGTVVCCHTVAVRLSLGLSAR